jgi:nucleotide-binding universal stress UspA family protein
MRVSAKKILVPVNGQPVSERTFRWACQAAKESKAELHALYVIEVQLELPLEAEITEDINRGEEILTHIEAIGAQEKVKNVQAKYLRARDAGPAIVLESRDRDMDLIMLGIPYRRHFNDCDMGTTASYIFHNAVCQLLLWRESASTPGLPRA